VSVVPDPLDHIRSLAGRGPFDRYHLHLHLLEHGKTEDGRPLGYGAAGLVAMRLIEQAIAAKIIEQHPAVRCYQLTTRSCPDSAISKDNE
jgi:hypothetical protein